MKSNQCHVRGLPVSLVAKLTGVLEMLTTMILLGFYQADNKSLSSPQWTADNIFTEVLS